MYSPQNVKVDNTIHDDYMFRQHPRGRTEQMNKVKHANLGTASPSDQGGEVPALTRAEVWYLSRIVPYSVHFLLMY